MKTREYKSLGLKVAFQVPENVQEFDTNAKKDGACLDEAINNVIYRGSLAEFRDTFLHGRKAEPAADGKPAISEIKGVEGITGIERLTEPVKGKDGKPVVKDGEPVTKYSESEGDYFERVLAQTNKKAEDFQSLADEVASSIAFDASASERKATGPKKLAQKYKLTAARILAGPNLSSFVSNKLSNIGKTFTPTGNMDKVFEGSFVATDGSTKTVKVSDADAETLGWLVKELSDWQERQALAGMTE